MSVPKRVSRFRRLLRQVGPRHAFLIKALETFGVRKTVKVRMCGFTIYVRTKTHDLVIAAEFLDKRPWEDLRMARGSAIIDAGANIGASTVYLASLFPSVKIIAIEPERENYALLEKNTQGLKHVMCVHAALWHEASTLELKDRTGGTIAFTIAHTRSEEKETGQTVECVTVEELCARFGIERIGLLKLDIEGAEKSVLEHSDEWISRVETIAAELHDSFVPGCQEAFDRATRGFSRFERRGDKSFAFRDRPDFND